MRMTKNLLQKKMEIVDERALSISEILVSLECVDGCAKSNQPKRQRRQKERQKEMYMDDFSRALNAFDSMLDSIARERRTNRSYAITSNPITEKREVTPIYSNKATHECGCECKKGLFDDIMKDVKSVIYNEPATIVTFSDGSKVCVKACGKDPFNKEIGLVYALVKRLYANDVDETTGYLISKGLGAKIMKIVEAGRDQKAEEAKRRAKKRAAKKEQKVKMEQCEVIEPNQAN